METVPVTYIYTHNIFYPFTKTTQWYSHCLEKKQKKFGKQYSYQPKITDT